MGLFGGTYNRFQAFKAPMIVTLDTSKGDALNQFIVPTRATYNYSVNWIADKGTPEEKTGSYNGVNPLPTITFNGSVGIHTLEMSGTQESWHFNNGGDKLKMITWDKCGDAGMIAFDSAYFGCSNMVGLPDDWCYEDVLTGGASMFNGTAITSLPDIMLLASLVSGEAMFRDAPLIILPSAMTLSNLVGGDAMFRNTDLTFLPSGITFSGLLRANSMFLNANITNVHSAVSLNSLTDGFRMFFNCNINTDDYSGLLIRTEANNQNNNVPFDGGDSTYNTTASVARQALIDDHSWTIDDGGVTYSTDDLTINTNNNINKNGKDYNGLNSVAWSNYCLFNQAIGSGVDGALYFQYKNISDVTAILGLDSLNTNKDFNTYDQAVYLDQATGAIREITNGTLSAVLATATLGAWLRLSRTSGNIILEYANDGINFTTIKDWGTISTTRYINLNLNNNLTFIRDLGGLNLV